MIREISFNEQNLIAKCIKIAKKNLFKNMILLGDLHSPCNEKTSVYGIFSGENLISFFTIFKGFKDPSVVLPYSLDKKYYDEIVYFLKTRKFDEFGFPTFEFSREQINNDFHVVNEVSEFCMINRNEKEFPATLLREKAKKVTKNDYNKIIKFYSSIDVYPFNPLQLKSGYYHYIEEENKIVAVAGTHFETQELAQLGNVYTLREFREKGYGTAVVAKTTQSILKTKKYASLFVSKENKKAISIYSKLGFEIFSNVRIFMLK